jgi:hypothetical protein
MDRITKGDWTVESDGTSVSMAGQVVIVAPAPDHADVNEQRGNASLIAAAPTMLKLIRETKRTVTWLINNLDLHPRDEATLVAMRNDLVDAYNKATR